MPKYRVGCVKSSGRKLSDLNELPLKSQAKMPQQGRGIASHAPLNTGRTELLDVQIPPRRILPLRHGIAGKMSRGFAMVRLQQSAQTLDADDRALVSFMLRIDDLVDALVNPFVMIVLKVLG